MWCKMVYNNIITKFKEILILKQGYSVDGDRYEIIVNTNGIAY